MAMEVNIRALVEIRESLLYCFFTRHYFGPLCTVFRYLIWSFLFLKKSRLSRECPYLQLNYKFSGMLQFKLFLPKGEVAILFINGSIKFSAKFFDLHLDISFPLRSLHQFTEKRREHARKELFLDFRYVVRWFICPLPR